MYKLTLFELNNCKVSEGDLSEIKKDINQYIFDINKVIETDEKYFVNEDYILKKAELHGYVMACVNIGIRVRYEREEK